MWSAAQRSAHEQWLSASEQERLAQFTTPDRRQEFIACRYALRLLLADMDDSQISQWPLDAPSGKAPCLAAKVAHARWHLSLSHSHGHIACAVAPQAVGVDLELLVKKTRRNLSDLAELACTSRERNELENLPDEKQRHLRFVQMWSLKEAWFKRAGTGVDFALLRRLECMPQRVAGATGNPHGDAETAAAHAWTAPSTAAGDSAAVLSLCTQMRDAHCVLHGLTGHDWQSSGRFVMHL